MSNPKKIPGEFTTYPWTGEKQSLIDIARELEDFARRNGKEPWEMFPTMCDKPSEATR